MHALDTRIPPPLVMLLVGVGMWLLARRLPGDQIDVPWHGVIAAAFVVIGLAFNLWPKRVFARVNTTINPMTPANSRHLVTTGLHGYSRNPMYVGQALLLMALAVGLQNAWAWLGLPAFVAYITVFQIRPEERALAERFGAAYAAYRATVRRWL